MFSRMHDSICSRPASIYIELLGTTKSGTKDDAIPITIAVPQQLYLLARPQLANGEAKVGHHHSLRLQPAIVVRAFAVLLLSELPLLELPAAKRLHKQATTACTSPQKQETMKSLKIVTGSVDVSRKHAFGQ